ncbi:MAG: NDP-sugar synthase [Phycisphaerales bacterium]|nr:NDP-sugar synthase [Phycisphaerales bacterium]
MNAVVLAGGIRSGLEVPGSGLPRALWPFPDEPLISHVLRFLTRSGCRDIAICANGKTKLIAAELASGETLWQSLHYSEDPLPRGPAGCLKDLQEWTGSHTLLCIQGTAWYDFDLAAMMDEHCRSAAAITVGALQTGHLHLEPAGVYFIEPYMLDLVPPVGYHDIKEQLIPKAIAAGMRVHCHPLRGQAALIHSPEHYLIAMRSAIRRAAAEPPADFIRCNDTIIHVTATVSSTAHLSGPIWIDAGAVVEEGVMLLGPVVVGTDVAIGADSLIRRSVVLRGACIPANSEAFSCILSPTKARRRSPSARLSARG